MVSGAASCQGSVRAALAMVCGMMLAVHAAETPAGLGPGERGVLPETMGGAVLFETGFEDGQPIPDLQDHKRVTDKAHAGRASIMGEIDKPNSACFLRIPFKGAANRRLELTFWVSSPDKTRCAVWAVTDAAAGKTKQGRRSAGAEDGLPRKWKRISAVIVPTTDKPGYFEIVTPSSYGGQPPGRVWIDDIKLTAGPATVFSLPHTEDFPVMTTDGDGVTWLAVVARPVPRSVARLYRVSGENRIHVGTIEPPGVTGIGVPDIAPLTHGCLLVVPVETDDRWRIGYVFADGLEDTRSGDDPVRLSCAYLPCAGNANIAPAVATDGNRTIVAWESNASGPRGIYASEVKRDACSPAVRLSATDAPSASPDVVALGGGRFLAAWDSCRERQVDLYGAAFEAGRWQPERRLTDHPRIERHVALAARDGVAWLAWQAQSFKRHLVNGVSEQRIVVARLDEAGLLAPKGIFSSLSLPNDKLMRPQIAFDGYGRLWVTARKSIDAHSGWQPLAWCCGGDQWSGPHVLWPDQGRWRPVSITFGDPPDSGLAVFQRDNLPRFWGVGVGKGEDWSSDAIVVRLPESRCPKAPPETVPLKMPETEFLLADPVVFSSADLPRQLVTHSGHELALYWGDMHEHTDMSVCQRAANPPADDLYANQRDIEKLDFTAITDHGYNIDRPQWAYTTERVRAFYDPGRFVSLLGEEWTSDQHQYDPKRPYRRYGHRNHIFLDTRFPRFFDSRDGDITPRMVWDQLSGVEFIAIPHQLADTGNCPTDWTWHDEHNQPLAEIFQQRQSFEYLGCPRQAPRATKFHGHFLQDAWALGLVIGVIASPDHGGGSGKAGVWCPEFTRESLFDAFHARHTFGTSGAKMGLFVSSGPHMMGDKALLPDSGKIPIRVRVVADRTLSKVVILRNNQVVHEIDPDKPAVDFTWTDEAPLDAAQAWYYVRVHREDMELAWSSPIWFFKTRADLDRTVQQARELPRRYPHGVPYGNALK